MRDDKDTELPPDDQRCTIIGWKWRCKHYKFQNSKFCRKHYLSHRGIIDGLSKKNRASHYCIDFKQGQKVEVSRKDESLKLSAWFKAKILKLPTKTRFSRKKKEEVLVQYNKNEMDLMSEIVDFSLIRPLPPPLSQETKSFERIEAFYNGGWWRGEIFEVLENGRYIVDCPIWGEKREVGVDELRIHQDWVDGEWLVPQHKGRDLATDGISNELNQSKRKSPTLRPRGRPRKKMRIEDIGVVSLSGQKEDVGEGSMSVDPRRSTLDGIITESCTTTNLMETDFTHKGRDVGTDRIANESDQRKRKTPMSRPRGRPSKNMHKEDTRVVINQWVDVPVREEGTHLNDSTGIFVSPSRSDNQTPSLGQEISTQCLISDMSEWPSNGNELEMLSNIGEAPPLSICSVKLVSPANPDDRMIDYDQVASEPIFAIVPGEASMDVAEQVEGALHQMKDTMQDATDIFTNLQISLSDGPQGDSSNTQLQLLQMSTKNTNSLSSDENNQQKRVVEEQINAVIKSSAQVPQCITPTGEVTDAVQSTSPKEDASIDDRFSSKLPFTKTYPLWETIEAMELFKSMPQHPHFWPLAEENEYIREGEAIGYMLSFVIALEKTRNIKFDEPVGTIAEILNALKDFKALGFDVHLVKDRLEKLLSIKSELLEYDVERKQVEAEILNSKLEENRLELNVAVMTEKMRELQEASSNMMKEKKTLMMKKQANDSEITALQRSIQEAIDEMQEINLQFSSVVAKPW